MFGGEMMLPVGFEIAIGGDGAEFQDGFGSVEAPAGTADIEAVGDEMAGCSLDDPGRDGPAGLECLVVAQELALGMKIADADIGAVTLSGAQLGLGGLILDGFGDFAGVTVQDSEGVNGDPVLSGLLAPGMETPTGRPEVLEDVDDVDDDVNIDAVQAGFGLDQLELMLGAVDQDHPAAAVAGIAGFGVGKDLSHMCSASCTTEPHNHLPRAWGPGRGV